MVVERMSWASRCAHEHRLWWRVTQRNKAFVSNGRGMKASEYSSLVCMECRRDWRTKAPYVASYRDITPAEREELFATRPAALILDSSQDTR
jgi:hypothetical protein